MAATAITKDQFEKYQNAGVYSFQIRVFTADDERVAVGSDNNLFRWGKDNREHEQEWLFIPSNERWKLLSMKDKLSKGFITRDGPILSIDANSGVVPFRLEYGNTASFKLNWIGENQDYVQLIENSKDELFTGHDFGWNRWGFVRWGDKNNREIVGQDKAQVYQIVSPRSIKENKNLKSDKVECKPGEIGAPPTLQKIHLQSNDPKDYPSKSKAKLVNQKIVSCLTLGLFEHRDKQLQIDSSPYYKINRYQYWDRTENIRDPEKSRGRLFRHFKGTKSEEKVSYTVGITEENYRTFTESFNVSSSVGTEFKGVSAEIAIEYGWTKENHSGNKKEITTAKEKTTTYESTLESGMYAFWSLVDRWEIIDYHGKTIKTFEVVSDTYREMRYPDDVAKR